MEWDQWLEMSLLSERWRERNTKEEEWTKRSFGVKQDQTKFHKDTTS